MAYLNELNPATPADGNWLKEGDDRIREAKAAMIERLETIFTDLDLDPLVFIAGVIPSAALADLLIATGKIADLAVTTGKLADLAVTDAKIAGMDGSKLVDASVATAAIANSAVSTSKIANLGVTTGKLADLGVTAAKTADGTMTNSKIADHTLIGQDKLADVTRQELLKALSANVIVATFVLSGETAWDSPAVAIAGTLTSDTVVVGYPNNTDGWTAKQKQLVAIGFINAAGNGKLRIINLSGSDTTVPDSTWTLTALRRYIDWP